jgi:hypothetical protein
MECWSIGMRNERLDGLSLALHYSNTPVLQTCCIDSMNDVT